MSKEKQHNEDFCIGSTNRGVTDTEKSLAMQERTCLRDFFT